MMRLSPLIISFWIVGFTEQIIDAGVVKAGELDENFCRNIMGTDFIFGITCLRHA